MYRNAGGRRMGAVRAQHRRGGRRWVRWHSGCGIRSYVGSAGEPSRDCRRQTVERRTRWFCGFRDGYRRTLAHGLCPDRAFRTCRAHYVALDHELVRRSRPPKRPQSKGGDRRVRGRRLLSDRWRSTRGVHDVSHHRKRAGQCWERHRPQDRGGIPCVELAAGGGSVRKCRGSNGME